MVKMSIRLSKKTKEEFTIEMDKEIQKITSKLPKEELQRRLLNAMLHKKEAKINKESFSQDDFVKLLLDSWRKHN